MDGCCREGVRTVIFFCGRINTKYDQDGYEMESKQGVGYIEMPICE